MKKWILGATALALATSTVVFADEPTIETLGDLTQDELAQEFDSMPDYFEAGDPVDGHETDGLMQDLDGNVAGPKFPAEWPASGVNKLTITIDKSEQRLYLRANGNLLATWLVSTGAAGHRTPNYSSRPVLKQVWNYWSRKYNAPMTWATFITPAIAIHSTVPSNYKYLGKPASHGCIRLTYTKAYWLFNYVAKFRSVTRITVQP